MYTDTHTHLYDDQIAGNAELIPRALAAGVNRMYMPNCHSTTIVPMLQIADAHPENCFPMMGLHPTYVKGDYLSELELVANWLNQRKFYAVGEIGLDYYWDLTYKTEQIAAFEFQIKLAQEHQLPIVIHARNSTEDCISVVKKHLDNRLTGIFHCFSGTLEDARAIVDMGFFLGVGGTVTYKNSAVPDILKTLSLQKVVLETDAPYLAPVPYRGKLNESSYIPVIAHKVAEIMNCSVQEVAEITNGNAQKVFGKP
jgi:TatD DNase family protein